MQQLSEQSLALCPPTQHFTYNNVGVFLKLFNGHVPFAIVVFQQIVKKILKEINTGNRIRVFDSSNRFRFINIIHKRAIKKKNFNPEF